MAPSKTAWDDARFAKYPKLYEGQGRKNPWQDIFRISRKKIRGGAWDFLTENLDFPYYLVRDRLKGSEARSPRDVKQGEGKVLKIDAP